MGADADVWLGIDLGTQGVRAVAVTADGQIAAAGSLALTRDHRDGQRHEQDPHEWWSAVSTAVQKVTAALGSRTIGAVAISSTSGTLLVCDRGGEPVGPALMYDDSRAVDEAAAVQLAGAEVWASLGYRMQRSWALPKLLWLQRTGALAPGVTVRHQADHVAALLVGRAVATDTSHALKTGYDLLNRQWPTGILDTLGVDARVLPAVVAPGTPIGLVSLAAAAATGLAPGTEVRAGMTDGCAAQVASRALAPGSWSSALGTTLVVKGATTQLLRDPHGAVYSHLHPDGGWLPGGASSTGAGIIARDFPGADLDELTRHGAAHDPAPGVTYPLAGRGERFPFVAADAHGFHTVPTSDPATRFAATIQGIALVERLAYDVLGGLGADISGPVTLSGGATRNPYFNQLRADVLGRRALLPESVEAAVGMAVLAAAPAGALAATAERMVRIAGSYEPDPQRGARYDEPYAQLCHALTERGWLDASVVAA